MDAIKKALAELGYSKFEIGAIVSCIEAVKFNAEPLIQVAAALNNAAKMNARLIQMEAGIAALTGAPVKAERKARVAKPKDVTPTPADTEAAQEAPEPAKKERPKKPAKTKESAEEIADNVRNLNNAPEKEIEL